MKSKLPMLRRLVHLKAALSCVSPIPLLSNISRLDLEDVREIDAKSEKDEGDGRL